MALALAVLILAALLIPLAQHWRAARDYPFQLDAEEGFILNQALTLARGGSLYTPITRPPFLVGNYTPLFPWVYSWLTGTRATPRSLPLGRALVQLAALGAALALAGIVLARRRRVLSALLAPLLFLSAYEVFHWGAFVRVDLPALFFTVAGLGAFLLIRPRWGMVAAAVLFVLAAATRQTAILAPLACALALALHDRKRLAWFLIPYAGLGLLGFAWLEWRTGGEFTRHVVVYNQNRLDWSGWRMLMHHEIWFWYHWLIGALALTAALWVLERARGRRRVNVAPGGSDLRELPHTRHALAIYALLAALSLLSYAKIGAAPNYALEPLLGAILWGMDALGRLLGELRIVDCGLRNEDERGVRSAERGNECGEKDGSGVGWRMRLGILVVALLVLAHAATLGEKALRFSWSPTPTADDRATGREVWLAARGAPGDIFCEEPIFSLLAGKSVLEQPFIMAQLAREGQWDDAPFCRLLAQRRFSLVIVNDDLAAGAVRGDYERYTPGMARALRAAYVPDGQITLPGLRKTYFLWRPRP